MKRTRLEGLYFWGRYQPDRQLDFNGFFWARPDGGILFDPMEMDAGEAEVFEALGGARHVVLTNFDHLRATAELKEARGLEVWAPQAELVRFGDAVGVVDHAYTAETGFPDPFGIRAFELSGGKSDVEMALYLEPLHALLFGDAVRSHAAGTLQLLPEPKLRDRRRLVTDLSPLATLPLEAVLLGDGESLFFRAEEAFQEFVARGCVPA